MAVLPNCIELHPPQEYTVFWRQTEGTYRFRHRVVACSEKEARLASEGVMREALGRNCCLWEIATALRRCM